MAASERPIVAITMGDACGIGPEITVKALVDPSFHRLCRPVVIGDGTAIRSALKLTGSKATLRAISRPTEAAGTADQVDLIDLKNLRPEEITAGKLSAACGRASMEYIERAARLALAGEAAAIVTAPINKEATRIGGYGDVGHLEFLARLTGAANYATMLVSGELRVVHLTTHYSLAEACRLVTEERVLGKIRLTHDSFRKWGFEKPRIGVAALNPHAGEAGQFGREEIEQITPAVQQAQALGIDARGPYPADSIFNRAINGEFDTVLAMYHDQGHIAVKVHGFEQSVSVALGLPFIRTSVDHGTAFDIAGKGIAKAESMAEAIKVAISLVQRGRLST
jgi:4-hydroxythreonine-4-phosphate dehydrogenase